MEEGQTGIAWETDSTVARTKATKFLPKRIAERLYMSYEKYTGVAGDNSVR